MLFSAGSGRLSNSSSCWKGALLFIMLSCMIAGSGISQTSRKQPQNKPSSVKSSPSSVKPSSNVAQLNQIRDLLKQNKYNLARPLIDEYLANPKLIKTAEIWYFKGKTYAGLTAESNTSFFLPDSRRESLEAFRKSLETDSNQAVMLLTLDSYQPVYSLYTSGMQQAVEHYNAEKYDDALRLFRETTQVGSFIYLRGWGLSKLDTTITLYSALAAWQSKKEADAIGYFKQLADADVGGTAENAIIYRMLARYFYEKNDQANMFRYVNASLKHFPDDDFIPMVLVDYYRDKKELNALYTQFDRILERNPNHYEILLEYAHELFSETHLAVPLKRTADTETKHLKIETLLMKALSLKPSSPNVSLSLGMHYYNLMLLQDEDMNSIKGNRPEDDKRRADLLAESIKLADKALHPLESVFKYFDAMRSLSIDEKSDFKTTCSLLTYVHEKKQQKSQADFYQQKYDAIHISAEK
jgi:hypothetical protein